MQARCRCSHLNFQRWLAKSKSYAVRGDFGGALDAGRRTGAQRGGSDAAESAGVAVSACDYRLPPAASWLCAPPQPNPRQTPPRPSWAILARVAADSANGRSDARLLQPRGLKHGRWRQARILRRRRLVPRPPCQVRQPTKINRLRAGGGTADRLGRSTAPLTPAVSAGSVVTEGVAEITSSRVFGGRSMLGVLLHQLAPCLRPGRTAFPALFRIDREPSQCRNAGVAAAILDRPKPDLYAHLGAPPGAGGPSPDAEASQHIPRQVSPARS
jgi:hypothetical protein